MLPSREAREGVGVTSERGQGSVHVGNALMGCETEGEWIEEARENEGWDEVQGGDGGGRKAKVYVFNPRGEK
jgi:hypothetical protein